MTIPQGLFNGMFVIKNKILSLRDCEIWMLTEAYFNCIYFTDQVKSQCMNGCTNGYKNGSTLPNGTVDGSSKRSIVKAPLPPSIESIKAKVNKLF